VRENELGRRFFIKERKKLEFPKLPLGQRFNYNPRSKDFECEWNPREERES